MSYTPSSQNTLRVALQDGEFSSLKSCIDYLSTLSTTDGYVIKIDGGAYDITDTITINLTMPIQIEGAGSEATLLRAATGLLNKHMFVIQSDVNVSKVEVNGSTLAGWSTGTNASLFRYDNSGVYSELINIGMYGCKKAIELVSASEVFCFNFIIDSATTGVEVNAIGTPAIDFEVGNFVNCAKSIDLKIGTDTGIYLSALRFISPIAGIGIAYDGVNLSYDSFTITGCEHNHVGTFLSGFDFTIARDANIEVLNCVGAEDKVPHAKINVEGAAVSQALTSNTWTKSTFVNTWSYTTKFGIADNKMTFLSKHTKDVRMWININLLTTTQPCELRVAVVKNGNTAAVYGRMGFFADINNRPFNVSTTVYLDDVVENDFFEIYLFPVGANETVIVKDVTWLADSR